MCLCVYIFTMSYRYVCIFAHLCMYVGKMGAGILCTDQQQSIWRQALLLNLEPKTLLKVAGPFGSREPSVFGCICTALSGFQWKQGIATQVHIFVQQIHCLLSHFFNSTNCHILTNKTYNILYLLQPFFLLLGNERWATCSICRHSVTEI